MYNVFKVNQTDDTCASEIDQAKGLSLGLTSDDVLTYKQIFFNKREKKSYLEKAEELRKKFKCVHTGRHIVAEKRYFYAECLHYQCWTELPSKQLRKRLHKINT